MKTIILFLTIFLATAASSSEIAEDETQTAVNPEEMVEFCAAALIVVRNLPEYEKWRERYEPNPTLVSKWQARLEFGIAFGDIKGSDVLDTATGCLAASNEERAEEDMQT